jgi:very-short-patch-repair endonuclease
MKIGRVNSGYQENASKLHRSIGDVIKTSPFAAHTWIQEYPVARVDSTFPSKRERFDWACPDLKIIIEGHGRQHYEPTSFGKGNDRTPEQLLQETQHRDEMKRQAAVSVGWTYIVIKYDEIDNLDGEGLWRLYRANYNEEEVVKLEKPKRQYRKVSYDKEKAREMRRAAYQKRKQWLKEQKAKENV